MPVTRSCKLVDNTGFSLPVLLPISLLVFSGLSPK